MSPNRYARETSFRAGRTSPGSALHTTFLGLAVRVLVASAVAHMLWQVGAACVAMGAI